MRKALRRVRILMRLATDESWQSRVEYGLVTTIIALGAAVTMLYLTVAISHALLGVAARFRDKILVRRFNQKNDAPEDSFGGIVYLEGLFLLDMYVAGAGGGVNGGASAIDGGGDVMAVESCSAWRWAGRPGFRRSRWRR